MRFTDFEMEGITVIEASRQAAEIIFDNKDLNGLYVKAVRLLGEGELHQTMLQRIVDAVEIRNIGGEVFSSGTHLFSFCCGMWIQFLLTEIAGVNKESLREVVIRITNSAADTSYH